MGQMNNDNYHQAHSDTIPLPLIRSAGRFDRLDPGKITLYYLSLEA